MVIFHRFGRPILCKTDKDRVEMGGSMERESVFLGDSMKKKAEEGAFIVK